MWRKFTSPPSQSQIRPRIPNVFEVFENSVPSEATSNRESASTFSYQSKTDNRSVHPPGPLEPLEDNRSCAILGVFAKSVVHICRLERHRWVRGAPSPYTHPPKTKNPLIHKGFFAPRAGLEPATLRLRHLHSFRCGPDYIIILRLDHISGLAKGCRALMGLIGEIPHPLVSARSPLREKSLCGASLRVAVSHVRGR